MEKQYNAEDIIQGYLDKIAKKLKAIKIKRFSFSIEPTTDCWYWDKEGKEFTIYATFGWERLDKLPIDIHYQTGTVKHSVAKNCSVSKLTFELDRKIFV